MKPDTRPFDITEMLQDDESIAECMTLVIEDGDPALLDPTLGDIARARGMTQIAKDTGIGRVALYQALHPVASPRFDAVDCACNALGVKLVAQPVVF